MKKISILVPTYNEEGNIIPISQAIIKTIENDLPEYDYELLFIDNDSQDNTKPLIKQLCNDNFKIKAIFNAKNFGPLNSYYYGICNTDGDCTIPICADFQEPVEMIPKFVHEWEKGYEIVCGIKTSSNEHKLMYFIRSLYYKIIKKMSSVEQIEHFTGFGLYDKNFVKILRNLNDPTPFIRGIVAEFGSKKIELSYTQDKRRTGKSHFNFYNLYEYAMLSFTSYTKIGMRLAVFIGSLFSVVSLVIAGIYLVLKLLYWNYFPMGMAPVLIGVFVLGSIQLFFIGLLGEYILSINTRIMNRPLVIEESRHNFKNQDEKGDQSNGNS